MKRRDLIGYLLKERCILIREGAKHSVFFNSEKNKTSTVPRHNEINNELSKKICKDLAIAIVKKK